MMFEYFAASKMSGLADSESLVSDIRLNITKRPGCRLLPPSPPNPPGEFWRLPCCDRIASFLVGAVRSTRSPVREAKGNRVVSRCWPHRWIDPSIDSDGMCHEVFRNASLWRDDSIPHPPVQSKNKQLHRSVNASAQYSKCPLSSTPLTF